MSDRDGIFRFGQFRVDVLPRSLERKAQPVVPFSKAFEILRVLFEQRREVVDKGALMRQVWPDTQLLSWFRRHKVSPSDSHRIVDTDSAAYYIPSGWIALKWEGKNGEAFSF